MVLSGTYVSSFSSPVVTKLPTSTTQRYYVQYFTIADGRKYEGVNSLYIANLLLANPTTYSPKFIISVTNPILNNDNDVAFTGTLNLTLDTPTQTATAVTLRQTQTLVTITFNLSASDAATVPSLITGKPITLVSSVSTSSPISNTITDVNTWIAANSATITNTLFNIKGADGATLSNQVLLTTDYNFISTTVGQYGASTVTLGTTNNTVTNPTSFYLSFAQQHENQSVVVKAANGVQKTFILTASDASGINPINVVSASPTTAATNGTLQDVLNFFLANGVTPTNNPPPTPSSATAQALAVDSIGLTWVEPAYANMSNLRYLVKRGGVAIVQNYPTTQFTDTGLTANTTYQYSIMATDIVTGLSSGILQITGVTLPAPVQGTNFGFTVQTACGVLRVIATPSEYNTWTTANNTNNLQTIIQGNLNVPNSLTYSTFANGNLTDNSNFVNQLAQISNCYKTITPPTPKNWGQILFGVFSFGVVASLLTGNGFKKGKKR